MDRRLRQKYASRQWLNADPERLAFIATATSAEVNEPEGPTDWTHGHVEGDVTIADCTRQAHLDFSVHWSQPAGKPRTTHCDGKTPEEHAQAQLDKLDLLIGELREFRKEYVKRLKAQGLV